MTTVITLRGVTKSFGAHKAVNNISLEVPKGAVFGFLGANGAGKSTTINMLVNFLRPSDGSVKVFGLDSVEDSLEIRRRIGFLAGDFALDKGLTGWQQLEYFGHLKGGFDRKYVRELAERLDCNLDKKFKNLSRGNKQKVGLISALMHKPELLIFDEPTSGLDPLIQAEFNKIILEQKEQGVTTFISSHVLSEVQEICDYVTFIRNGEIVASKPLQEILSSAARQVTVTGLTKSTASKIVNSLKTRDHEFGGDTLGFAYSGDINDLVRVLAKHKLKDVSIKEQELETIFMGYYEADHA